MSTEKETTFCTHKGYNTVAPCDDSCFSQHSQTEIIEWKDREYEFEVLTSYESPYAGKSSIQHQAYREGASKMFDVLLPHLKQAITTAVAKRDTYLVEEVESIKGYGNNAFGGQAFTRSICKGCGIEFMAPSTLGGLCHHCESFSQKVLSILKH